MQGFRYGLLNWMLLQGGRGARKSGPARLLRADISDVDFLTRDINCSHHHSDERMFIKKLVLVQLRNYEDCVTAVIQDLVTEQGKTKLDPMPNQCPNPEMPSNAIQDEKKKKKKKKSL